jgi:hypothetical protein
MKTEGQRVPQRQRTLICDSVTSLGRPLTIILLSPETGPALVGWVALPAPRAGLVDFAIPPTGAAAGREARGALRRRPADLREALWISARLWSSLLDILEAV